MEIPDKNLFMMCESLNTNALSKLSEGYYIRNCTQSELDKWKAIHFDDPETASLYLDYMTQFFNDTYAQQEALFYEKCLFVCNRQDEPIGTCFIWKAYDQINTLHWFKVIKSYEAQGIGRALLSTVMKQLRPDDYPIFLHTQPSSYRAIKLYSDFGFVFISDPIIGYRENHLEESLSILKAYMPETEYKKLKVMKAPEYFLEAVLSSPINQF